MKSQRDNLPRPNCNSDGKADNKRQALINTDTIHFKIHTGDMGPPLAWPQVRCRKFAVDLNLLQHVGLFISSSLTCFLKLTSICCTFMSRKVKSRRNEMRLLGPVQPILVPRPPFSLMTTNLLSTLFISLSVATGISLYFKI